MWNYESIKQLAKERGESITTLLALAPKNDPFYTGTPAEVEAARWVQKWWERFDYSAGVHVRRFHYKLISQEKAVTLPSLIDKSRENPAGTRVYQNTQGCWAWLANATKHARYLGFIPVDAFVDRRNQPAQIFTEAVLDFPEPGYAIVGQEDSYDYYLPDPTLPTLPTDLPGLPKLSASGYDGVRQSHLVELWAEKTTMDDVLLPLCAGYGANLITGAGELSITAVRHFLARVREDGRPARILYVSDFDPAGIGMPISVARKIEFYQRNEGEGDLDLSLEPIVLTDEQVNSYDLPRIPVKASDRRKDAFEASHGEGQVELDALEAIHPGELSRIVEDAILRYFDPTLEARSSEAEGALQAALDGVQRAIGTDDYAELRGEYSALLADFGETRARFKQQVDAQFASELAAYQEKLDRILERADSARDRYEEDLGNVDVSVDDYPMPTPDIEGDVENMLYESGRDYVEQIEAYRVHRRGQKLA